MESVTECPVCASTHRCSVTSRGKDFAGQQVVACCRCGTHYQAQRLGPAELDEYYRHQYSIRYRGSTTPDPRAIEARDQVARYRFERLRRHGLLRPNETILELGCGAGNFLRLCDQGGLRAWGVEPSEGYAEYARAAGSNVETGVFPTCQGGAECYDAIALFHVLEHLPKPLEVMASVRGLLAPHGVVVLEVPELGRALGPRWSESYFHAPHLLDFTRASLRYLLESAGFVPTLEDFGPSPRRRHHLLVAARPDGLLGAPSMPNVDEVRSLIRRVRTWIAVSRVTAPAARRVRRIATNA